MSNQPLPEQSQLEGEFEHIACLSAMALIITFNEPVRIVGAGIAQIGIEPGCYVLTQTVEKMRELGLLEFFDNGWQARPSEAGCKWYTIEIAKWEEQRHAKQ